MRLRPRDTADCVTLKPRCFNNSTNYSECGVTLPGIAPYIGQAALSSDDLQEYYEENYPLHYLHVNGGLNLDSLIDSFFDLYLVERSEWTHTPVDLVYNTPDPDGTPVFNYTTFTFEVPEITVTLPAGSSLAVTGEDGSLADMTPSPHLATQIGDDEHANYPLAVNPDDAQYRRRMSVPLVNCSNMDFDASTGVAEVEILEFVDMYLLQPPRAICDASGTDQCNNQDLMSASVFTEFLGKSDYIETEYPELVR